MTAPYLNFSCQVVAYAFSWFPKCHGFMILTGTMKIGIQRFKLPIYTERKINENFNHTLINLLIVFLIIMLYCTQY